MPSSEERWTSILKFPKAGIVQRVLISRFSLLQQKREFKKRQMNTSGFYFLMGVPLPKFY